MMAMPPGGYHFDSLRPHDMNIYLNHHHLFSPMCSQEPAQVSWASCTSEGWRVSSARMEWMDAADARNGCSELDAGSRCLMPDAFLNLLMNFLSFSPSWLTLGRTTQNRQSGRSKNHPYKSRIMLDTLLYSKNPIFL